MRPVSGLRKAFNARYLLKFEKIQNKNVSLPGIQDEVESGGETKGYNSIYYVRGLLKRWQRFDGSGVYFIFYNQRRRLQ